MGSVSGDAPHNAQALADLALAMEGGDGFAQRLASLEMAKRSHQAAYDKLKVGNDVRTALDDANRLREQAVKMRDDADRQAKEIIATATAAAANVKVDADKYNIEVRKVADGIRADAETFYQRKTTEANTLHANAQSINSAASALLAKHDKMYNEVQAVRAEVETVRNDLKASQDLFLKKHKTLSDFLAKMK